MKGYIRWLLRNRVSVVVAFLSIVAFGIFVYRELPLDAIPDAAPPMVQVFTESPGLSAQEVERFITYPLEMSLMGLPGVEKVRSVSNFGLSMVTLYFRDGTDIYRARQLVGERLQEVREELQFGSPEMGPISTATGLILFYYLEDTTGKYSLQELRTIQDWMVKPRLMSVEGVNEVLSIGGFVRQYHVLLDPYRMYNYRVGLLDVVDAIERNNSTAGGQFIVENGQEVVVRSSGMLGGIRDIGEVFLRNYDGFPVLVRDVAAVKEGGEIRRGLQTMNGEGEVVAGMVIKLFGTNSSRVISRVEEKIQEINSILPEGVRIVPYYQQKSLVEAVLRTVLGALLLGVVLIIAVLFLFLRDLRSGLVVVLSLPFSLLVAVILMKFYGISLNLMSVGGLAIALGILVDATIVVVENIHSYRERHPGSSIMEAVVNASSMVMGPVMLAIVITLLAFVPLLFLEGVEGRMFRPLLYSMLFAIAGSMLYAFAISPVVGSFLMNRAPVSPGKLRWMANLYRLYGKLFRTVVSRGSIVLILYGILAGLSFFLFRSVGTEFIPGLREGTLVVRASLHPAVSLNEARRVALIVERLIMEVDGVREVTSRIGRGEVGAHTDPISSIETFVILEDGVKQERVEEEIRERLEGFPGVIFNFTQPIKMATDELLEGVRGDVVVKVFGENLDTLQIIADRIAGMVRDIDGVVDVRAERLLGTPQILISIDRERAARYGLDVDDVNEVVRFGIGGDVVGSVYEGVRKVDIFLRLKDEYRNNPEAIRRIPVYSHGGAIVPLGEIARIDRTIAPRQIVRENFQRFSVVSFNVRGRDVGSVVEDVEKVLRSGLDLPAGYSIDIGGQYELQRKAARRFAIIVPIVLFLIMFLLISHLRSFSMALSIMLSLPVAISGGAIALYLTGTSFSVPASIGFIALLGIASEVSIVLMSFARNLLKRYPVERAMRRAVAMRWRAVSMTVLTTGFGLLPLVFSTGAGSEVQRPLAIVVIGGLITLIVSMLFLLPGFVILIYRIRERFTPIFRRW